MNELRELYEEVILEHNRNPRNYPKRPEGCNRSAHGYNPLCGDDVQIHLRVEGDVVADVGFEGDGCAISTASASLMTEAVKGRTVAEAGALFARVRRLLTGDAEPDVSALGKLQVLAGVREFPVRVKCASLPWHTMAAALAGQESATTE